MFVIFDFHQLALNGNLLHEKLSSAWYNRTVVMKKKTTTTKIRFLKAFCVSLNLNFPGERKNYGNGSFP